LNTKKAKTVFVCLIVLLTMPFALSGQRYISGRITDALDGNGIPSVMVFIAGTATGTSTDLDGNYRLRIIGAGSYQLVVSCVGYQTVNKDIEPGNKSLVFDADLQVHELGEIEVSAKVQFRQRDINLFWRTILGKNPAPRTIQAKNSKAVYYFYNTETRILTVTCREPLQIINNETGYHIHYILNNFKHDYNTGITNWNYQYLFTELKPATIRQKEIWEKNRTKVYDVSIPKFIRSLYHNSLLSDGFVLASIEKKEAVETIRSEVKRSDTPPVFYQFSLLNPDSIIWTNPDDNSKTLNLSDSQIMLICYGRPVTKDDLSMITQNSKISALFANILIGDSICFLPDGTYANRLGFSPVDFSNSLLGLNMKLPIEYIPELFAEN
jgi:hypothetical protein